MPRHIIFHKQAIVAIAHKEVDDFENLKVTKSNIYSQWGARKIILPWKKNSSRLLKEQNNIEIFFWDSSVTSIQ
jgi:hypothetical protein